MLIRRDKMNVLVCVGMCVVFTVNHDCQKES